MKCKCKGCSLRALKICGVALCLFGVICLCIAAFLPDEMQRQLKDTLDDVLILTLESQASNSDVFESWANPASSAAAAVFFNIYVFNITNPQQALQGAIPLLQELGPYVYRSMNAKLNVSFEMDKRGAQVVQWRSWNHFVFDRHKTASYLDPKTDSVVSLNLPFQLLKTLNFASVYANSNDTYRLYTKRSVHDIVWGYQDADLKSFFPGLVQNMTRPATANSAMLVGNEPYEQVVHQYLQWQGQKSLTVPGLLGPQPLWSTWDANQIQGTCTDGLQFASGIRKGQSLVAFFPRLSRTLPLSNIQSESFTWNSIELLRFRVPKWVTQNSTSNPDNSAYFQFGPNGLGNLSRATNTPLFWSKPHFLDCDNSLLASVRGVSPNRDVHDTWIDVEPITGLSVFTRKRHQLSVQITPYVYRPFLQPTQTWFPNIRGGQIFWPVAWFEEISDPSDIVQQTTNIVYNTNLISSFSMHIGTGVGVCCLCLGFLMLAWPRCFLCGRHKAAYDAERGPPPEAAVFYDRFIADGANYGATKTTDEQLTTQPLESPAATTEDAWERSSTATEDALSKSATQHRESACASCRKGFRCTPTVYRFGVAATFVCGVILMVAGILLGDFLHKQLQSVLDDILILSPKSQAKKSDSYELFSDAKSSRAPHIFFNIYVYNITNAQAALNGAQPAVQEIGPYVYREFVQRFNISFGVDRLGAQTVSFKTWPYFVFDRERTPSRLDPRRDVITSLNMPFQLLSTLGLAFPYANFNDSYRLFTTRSVHEIMWGYRDRELGVFFPGLGRNTTHPENVTDPKSTLYTGAEPYEHLVRSYRSWKDQTYLQTVLGQPLWTSPSANRVFGSDAMQFPRDIRRGQTVDVLSIPTFKVIPMENLGKESYTFKNIELYRFKLPEYAYVNATVNPARADYYSFGPSGLSNLSRPMIMPIFFSKPRFLDCDSQLFDAIGGLQRPVRDLHDTWIDIEPITGLTMRAAKRNQVNVRVTPYTYQPGQVWFRNIHNGLIYWPVLWIEEATEVPDSLAQQFASNVYTIIGIADYSKWVGVGVGVVFIVIGLLLLMLQRKCFCADSRMLPPSQGLPDSFYSSLHEVADPFKPIATKD